MEIAIASRIDPAEFPAAFLVKAGRDDVDILHSHATSQTSRPPRRSARDDMTSQELEDEMKSSDMKLGRTEQGWVSRIEGPGTVAESPAFERLVVRVLEQSPDARLIVDFSDCEMLDSTFLGCLASLHRRFSVGAMPKMVIYAPADVIQRLFGSTQLDRHLHIRSVAPPECGEWMDVPLTSLDERALARHIMEAHKTLARAGGPLAAAFEAIAQQFADELAAA